MTKRKHYPADFGAKVARDAIREELTTTELAKTYGGNAARCHWCAPASVTPPWRNRGKSAVHGNHPLPGRRFVKQICRNGTNNFSKRLGMARGKWPITCTETGTNAGAVTLEAGLWHTLDEGLWQTLDACLWHDVRRLIRRMRPVPPTKSQRPAGRIRNTRFIHTCSAAYPALVQIRCGVPT